MASTAHATPYRASVAEVGSELGIDDAHPSGERRTPWWIWWAAGFALAIVLAFFYAAQDYLSQAVERLPTPPWRRLLRGHLLGWLLWCHGRTAHRVAG